MQSKQYFTKIKNYPHEKSTEPKIYHNFFEIKGHNVNVKAILDAIQDYYPTVLIR